MILPCFPFHILCIDILGPLPLSDGFTYVLTALDCFTRWPVAIPLESTKAEHIAQVLFRHILCMHGCPYKILSDKGRNLIAEATVLMCDKWGIRKIETTGHQPQSVPVERFHRYLNVSMSALHNTYGLGWNAYIDAAVFMYRVSLNDSTGYSPYQLLYGRNPTLPDDTLLPDTRETDLTVPDEYHKRLAGVVSAAYKSAYEYQLAMAESNAMLRAEILQTKIFFPGQDVMYYVPNSAPRQEHRTPQGNKTNMITNTDSDKKGDDTSDLRTPNRWRHDFTGPHTVMQKNGPNTYECRDGRTATRFIANVNRLLLKTNWSQEVGSGAQDPQKDIRTDRPWKIGGSIAIGSLFVISLEDPDVPFGVCRLLGRKEDGALFFQWMYNHQNNIHGNYLPGWSDPTADNPRGHYYSMTPTKKHLPLTSDIMKVSTTFFDEDAVVHGFNLTNGNKLTPAILRIISDDHNVMYTSTRD
jgi:hypothetical protein